MKNAIATRDESAAKPERNTSMIVDQNRHAKWKTEKWAGSRQLPAGYVITNILNSNGVAEIVAWAPQRDRAEQIARELNELRYLRQQNGN
jgi:hypothetical protein